MEEALERSQEDHAPDLKVSFLLDYTRGSRGPFLSFSYLFQIHTQACSDRRELAYSTQILVV